METSTIWHPLDMHEVQNQIQQSQYHFYNISPVNKQISVTYMPKYFSQQDIKRAVENYHSKTVINKIL